MKVFSKDLFSARQGEAFFIRTNAMLGNLKEVEPIDGKYILAHSETGHHHVMEARPNVKLFSTDNPLVSYLQIVEATDEVENLLVHLRGHDTHETIKFVPDTYRVVNARESSPDGWRKAAD